MIAAVWLFACTPPPTERFEPEPEPVCGRSWELLDAPANASTPAGMVSAVDLLSVEMQAVLDADGVFIESEARFLVGEDVALPALELLPEPSVVFLDGEPVSWSHTTVGDPARQLFVLDVDLDPCTEHTLSIETDLPLGWAAGAQARLERQGEGVFWSAGLEDASPGNFLGMWAPSNLLFDRFDLELSIDVQHPEAHQLAHTGERDGWTLRWTGIQAHTPFWVVSPVAETESAAFTASPADGPITVEVYALRSDNGAVIEQAGERAVVALERFSELFGPYHHGDRYVLWIRDDRPSSMEYDGATVTAMGAIEHEVMHSWYARGASPLTDADGWIDEAITSWATDFGPFRDLPGNFELEPVLLRHGDDGWDGPRLDATQYIWGSAIFSDTAHRYSVDEVIASLGAFYIEHAGTSYTDRMLEEHLTCWFDAEVRAAFFHLAYGAGPPEGIPEDWCR